ncbi:hypothetical protein SAMN00120144_2376 [Hymenobacter roseosalivarius DSM 11622]|uniref:YD repeat protein n=1 Tax=Hymenobacter roseosalivarius DSM 11622 TaxID=645990 RepID=A0A1W1VM26_9BACT|nr:hypothetical protein [Hymenobacter roseosalivarius]SMB94343.1 hypothetical protein SAMN00120144_2376 [Hymenobacter roseosalivarius DSM 11622]
MKFFILLFTLSLVASATYGQAPGPDRLLWSSTRRLQSSDFHIIAKAGTGGQAQYQYDYDGHPTQFMGKRGNNQLVRNMLLCSASSIDTTGNVANFLRFEQTLFDIQEVYIRRLRQTVRANAFRSLMVGNQKLKAEEDKITVEAAKRRLAYDEQTNYGTLPDKQMEWETIIQNELNALNEFSAK